MATQNTVHRKRRARSAYAAAWRHARERKYAEAVREFDEAIRWSDKDWGSYLWRGLALSELGDYELAVGSLEAALDISPSNPVLRIFLGRVHLDHGHYEEALEAFGGAAKQAPEHPWPAAYRTLTLLAQGKGHLFPSDGIPTDVGFLSRALVLVERALMERHGVRVLDENLADPELDPTGTKRGKTRPVPEAITSWYSLTAWIRAGLAHPVDRTLRAAARHVYIGDFFWTRHALKRACQEYGKALELVPDWHALIQHLARVELAVGQHSRAITRLHEVRDALPDKVQVDIDLGVAYCAEGDFSRALALLTAGAQRFRSDYRPAYHCGLAALHLGQVADARRWFEQALSVPNPQVVRRRMAELIRLSAVSEGQSLPV